MIGRLLCRIGLHAWRPKTPRGDGYARARCKRCDEPWLRGAP